MMLLSRWRSLLLLSLVLALTFVFHADATSHDWEEINSREGIRILSRRVEGSPILAFKGIAEMEIPIGTLISVINDKARHHEWVPRLMESKTIELLSPLESIEYTRVSGVWPIADRDVVFRSVAVIDEGRRQVIMRMTSVEHRSMPPREGTVRAELTESTYILTALSQDKTLVESEFHGDPRGWVPTWIANIFQKSWPMTTLESLRAQALRAEGGKYYPHYGSLAGYYASPSTKEGDKGGGIGTGQPRLED